jgi:hypothetical protein
MATALGVTYGYIAQLRTGHRRTEHIGQEFADACARYCAVPTVFIKLWARRILIDDFLWLQQSKRDRVVATMKRIFDDPVVGPLVPPAVLDSAAEVQEFICALFEESTSSHGSPLYAMPRMLEVLQRAAILDEEAEAELQRLRQEIAEPASEATA